MREFVYPIAAIFSESGLLDELKVKQYFIASYQRGYKWKSFGKNDQVSLFLTDTYTAFKDRNEEYYLQYITIKKNVDYPYYLEVIDGQQRLTTISLFFYVAHRLGLRDSNITKSKVLYERHGLDRDIFEIILDIQDSDYRLSEEQDIYYLYHAVQCIKKFLIYLTEQSHQDVSDYLLYLERHVKIIVNLEESITSAEEVFSNLNDNKVDLTDEFLIKGLLFTKSTRAKEGIRTFQEIQDLRSRLAYKWDEIDNWFKQKSHVDFFNGKKSAKIEGIGIILHLLRPDGATNNVDEVIQRFYLSNVNSVEKENVDHTHDLFNAYNDSLHSWNQVNTKLVAIINLSKRLKNWYYNNETNSLLGYYILTNGNMKELINLSTNALKSHLYQHAYDRCVIKNKNIEELSYLSDRTKLNNIFYALNIFRLQRGNEGLDIDFRSRIDFSSFNTNWTLEHIYPQNPKLKVAQDLIDFKSWFFKYLEKIQEEKGIHEDTTQLFEIINSGDIELITSSLGKFNKIFEIIGIDIHHIGNLALLAQGDNSSVSNHIFPHKRRIILNRINSGSFVPQHTIEAVTKYLHPMDCEGEEREPFDEDVWDWSEQDCRSNAQWIRLTYSQLLNLLAKKKDIYYEIGKL